MPGGNGGVAFFRWKGRHLRHKCAPLLSLGIPHFIPALEFRKNEVPVLHHVGKTIERLDHQVALCSGHRLETQDWPPSWHVHGAANDSGPSCSRRRSKKRWNCRDILRRSGFGLPASRRCVFPHLPAAWRHPADVIGHRVTRSGLDQTGHIAKNDSFLSNSSRVPPSSLSQPADVD